MSIKTKKRMPKCNCYPHPAFPNDPDFSVVERNETNWKWADCFLKCNICGRVAKNAITQKYAEKRQFPIAPVDWNRGPHPDFKERLEQWEYEQNQKIIAACDAALEQLNSKYAALTGQPYKPQPPRQNRSGWRQLPSGLIVPT